MGILELGLTARFIQTPLDAASAGDEEENKTVEDGQLALIDPWKKRGSHLELPVELEISHGHLATAKKRRPARPKPQHHGQSSQKLYDSAEPDLRPNGRLELGKKAEDLLSAMEREHKSRHDTR